MSTIEVKVPDIGDFTDVPVIEVLVKPGDTVAAEDSLVTLESDKATMDVPSPAAGTVKEVQDQGRRQGRAGHAGAAARRGRRRRGAAGSQRPQRRRSPRPRRPRRRGGCRAAVPPPRLRARRLRAAPAAPIDAAGFKGAHASPSVRKFARELGVDVAAGHRHRSERPDPAGRRAGFRQEGDVRPGRARGGRRDHRRRRAQPAARGRRSTSPSSARSSRSRCRGSRSSPAPTSRATG